MYQPQHTKKHTNQKPGSINLTGLFQFKLLALPLGIICEQYVGASVIINDA